MATIDSDTLTRISRAGRGFRRAKQVDDLEVIDRRYGDDRQVWHIALDGATLYDTTWKEFRAVLVAALEDGTSLEVAERIAYDRFSEEGASA